MEVQELDRLPAPGEWSKNLFVSCLAQNIPRRDLKHTRSSILLPIPMLIWNVHTLRSCKISIPTRIRLRDPLPLEGTPRRNTFMIFKEHGIGTMTWPRRWIKWTPRAKATLQSLELAVPFLTMSMRRPWEVRLLIKHAVAGSRQGSYPKELVGQKQAIPSFTRPAVSFMTTCLLKCRVIQKIEKKTAQSCQMKQKKEHRLHELWFQGTSIDSSNLISGHKGLNEDGF